MANKKVLYSIRITEELKEEFQKILKTEDVKQSKFFADLLKNYKNNK